MASSRLEKIGTIYARTSGLLRSGALNWEDRPLWYDLYEAFPPKEEPKYDRPAPKVQLRNIFYEEDKIRSMFHKNNKQIGAVNFFSKSKTLTQRFIETYKKLEQQYDGETNEKHLYEETIDILKRERDVRKEIGEPEENAPFSLSGAFKDAEQHKLSEQPKININVKDIFKD